MTHLEITMLEELRKADRVVAILKANIALMPQDQQKPAMFSWYGRLIPPMLPKWTALSLGSNGAAIRSLKPQLLESLMIQAVMAARTNMVRMLFSSGFSGIFKRPSKCLKKY